MIFSCSLCLSIDFSFVSPCYGRPSTRLPRLDRTFFVLIYSESSTSRIFLYLLYPEHSASCIVRRRRRLVPPLSRVRYASSSLQDSIVVDQISRSGLSTDNLPPLNYLFLRAYLLAELALRVPVTGQQYLQPSCLWHSR